MNGEGIAHFEGYTLFVPYAAKGAVVRVRVQHIKGNVAHCTMVSEIEPAPCKNVPPCEVFGVCGGCALQHVAYDVQLDIKRQQVVNCLYKAGVAVDGVEPTVPSPNLYGYRNKLQLPVRNVNGKTEFGFFREGSHDVVPIEHCLLHGEWARTLIDCMRRYVRISGITPYDENTAQGILRHVVARYVDDTLMLVLVVNGNTPPMPQALTDILKGSFAKLSWGYSINTKRTNVIMFDDYHPVVGTDSIECDMYGLRCALSPLSFLQINESVADKIYDQVVSCIPKGATVVDLYSGIGIMTARIARKAKRVYGVEVVEAATRNADRIMKANGIDNVTNYCADAADKIDELARLVASDNEKGEFVIVLDPPRKGCDTRVLRTILSAAPDRILYVSCNPATLARDLAILTADDKYALRFVRPFDMFPQSGHVETLVQLSHKTPDSHIVVKVDFDKDNSIQTDTLLKNAQAYKPAERVTYKMIQAYVEEKYGFKVHTAYIAEVKRSYGLPMYDAPNAVEELKRPRQHPSEKMIEAIKDALNHFGII